MEISERRREKRIFHQLLVDFEAEGPPFLGITQNFSKGGMYIMTAQPYTAGRTVRLNLLFPAGGKTQLSGTVVRTDTSEIPSTFFANGMAVQFNASEAAYHSYLTAYGC